MKIVVSIEHPAWAHQFHFLIKQLIESGHLVKVFTVNKDHDAELLDTFNINYEIVGKSTGKNIIEKIYLLFIISFRIFIKCIKYKPDIFIGRASPMMAINSFLFGKPHIIFEDTEHSYISLFFCKLFSRKIFTNSSFRKNLGRKQIRCNTYKELFYLHPNWFTPDINVLTSLGLQNQKFTIIRFVAWQADHDYGHKGLTYEMKKQAIKTFEKYGKVFITSELELPEEFQKYKLQIPKEKIHHLLYYATLLYGESSTMATEAAVLGTHSIFCDFIGRGYTDELENKYNLVYNFSLDNKSIIRSIEKAEKLLKNHTLWEEGKQKQLKLLGDKCDGTDFMFQQILNN
ncbi:MAG: hypothetical protein A2046_14170 [Bacteroidetes bacterium GWA2_30_7]|nr:MAG: hypothetical protein A2046_14170 [Bacteroidetes bacterium GWA2_30_7]